MVVVVGNCIRFFNVRIGGGGTCCSGDGRFSLTIEQGISQDAYSGKPVGSYRSSRVCRCAIEPSDGRGVASETPSLGRRESRCFAFQAVRRRA